MSSDEPGATSTSAAQDGVVTRLLMRRNQQEAVAIVDALRRRGLSPVVLKGAGVQHHLYAGAVRTSSDVDLLVAPSEQRRARRVLADLGFSIFGRTGHATSWTAPGRTPVDLHRTLPYCQVGARAAWRTLAGHHQTIAVETGSLTVLDRPGTAVHLTIHLTQGAGDRQLADLHRAVLELSADEWSQALTIARALGTAPSMAWALDQVPGGAAVRARLGMPEVARVEIPPLKPSEAGVARFVASPVHWRERSHAVVPSVRRVTSRRSLTGWASIQGRPVPTTTLDFAATLAARTWHHLRSGHPHA
jgi:hypothetical protein